MKTTERVWILILSLLATVGVIYSFRNVLTPFIVSFVLAYILNPFVVKANRIGAGDRTVWTTLIILSLFSLIAIALITLIPVLYKESTLLVKQLSVHSSDIHLKLKQVLKQLEDFLPAVVTARITDAIAEFSGSLLGVTGNIFSRVFHSGVVAVTFLSSVFIAPIVTFYLLRDWNNITSNISKLVPKHYREDYKYITHQIDKTLSGFLRGQFYVCFLLGCFYAIGLQAVGMKSGLLLGMVAGLMTFIPYVGAIFGSVLCMIIAAIEFMAWQKVLMVAAVFAVGQAIEGNFVAPKLVGDRVGLHPVWIMFGLLAGGSLFGFTGVLVAVPVTAIIGVFVKFFLHKYQQSKFYTG
jgi:predicted PurR-regulated permease PerM